MSEPGTVDLLTLIRDLCADARKHTDARCFSWAAASLENAQRAANTYTTLLAADTTAAAAAAAARVSAPAKEETP